MYHELEQAKRSNARMVAAKTAQEADMLKFQARAKQYNLINELDFENLQMVIRRNASMADKVKNRRAQYDQRQQMRQQLQNNVRIIKNECFCMSLLHQF
jgi:hypothetical protein